MKKIDKLIKELAEEVKKQDGGRLFLIADDGKNVIVTGGGCSPLDIAFMLITALSQSEGAPKEVLQHLEAIIAVKILKNGKEVQ